MYLFLDLQAVISVVTCVKFYFAGAPRQRLRQRRHSDEIRDHRYGMIKSEDV